MNIIPLILSGGAGKRLWPLSRESKPKQFLAFGGPNSLFQETVARCRTTAFDSRPIVVGADNHRFLLAEDLRAAKAAADILIEPLSRNSCAAIAAGCRQAMRRDPEALVLTLSVDQKIRDVAGFENAVVAGKRAALEGRLVAFGIRQSEANSEHGYILAGGELAGGFASARFVEKPEEAEAGRLVEAGYLVNTGNFLFRAAAFLAELGKLEPEILEAASDALERSATDLEFIRLDRETYERCPALSVDRAVMERTDRGAVVEVSHDWADLNDWDSIRQVLARGKDANAIIGDAVIVDGKNNLVHSENRLTAMIGVDDMIVVSTRDCILVARADRTRDVGALVDQLSRSGRAEAREALRIFRPWGNYERLDIDDGYQVKRIVVAPGGVLSLQKHQRRAEHWIVVRGTAEVTIDGQTRDVGPNQSVGVPLGAVHRLANRGVEPVVLIEVQTGDYLGEDDIVRFEDHYNRTGRT